MVSSAEQHPAKLLCAASWHYGDTLKRGQKLSAASAVSHTFSLYSVHNSNIQQEEALRCVWRANKGEGALISEPCLYYIGIKGDKTQSIALFVKLRFQLQKVVVHLCLPDSCEENEDSSAHCIMLLIINSSLEIGKLRCYTYLYRRLVLDEAKLFDCAPFLFVLTFRWTWVFGSSRYMQGALAWFWEMSCILGVKCFLHTNKLVVWAVSPPVLGAPHLQLDLPLLVWSWLPSDGSPYAGGFCKRQCALAMNYMHGWKCNRDLDGCCVLYEEQLFNFTTWC